MYIKVRVEPQSRKELFEKRDETHFFIKVKEKALAGSANNRVIELLAEHFGVSSKQVRIVNGHRSPSKLIHINNE